MTLVRRTLLFFHRDKENEPSSLNGTAPPRRRRIPVMNPYSQPLPFNQNEWKALSNLKLKQAPRSSVAKAPSSSKPTSAPTVARAQINEDSPAIHQILKAKGCSSVEELLARDQQKTQTNKATNRSKATSTNRNTGRAKAINRSKATKGASAATKGSKSSNVSKPTTNGSKSTSTNPKKKAKSKYFSCQTTPWHQNYVTHSFKFSVCNAQLHYSFEWIQVYE